VGALQMIGYPAPDADGTLRLTHRERDGKVELLCNGHAFVVCEVVDGKSVVRIMDCDTKTPVFTRDLSTLCWRRFR